MIKSLKLFVILLLITTMSCSDVIVPDDILDETVELISPANNLRTSTQTHTFWWEELETVEGYNLQIVSPDFDNPERLVLDTNIVGDNFTVTLSDNIYQWRVIGYNEAYESQFDVFDLVVANDSAGDLTSQIVNLQSPTNNFCSNNQTLMFLWDALTGADQYVLQIGNQDFTDLLLNMDLTDNFLEFTIGDEGEYFWRVRAESQSSQTFTGWTNATFAIDITSTVAPSLNSPAHDATLDYLNQDPDLEWTSATDSVLDSLFIYADEFGDTLLFKIGIEASSFNLEDSSIDFSNISFEENYYWELNSTDKAGNVSELSEFRTFYIEE